MMTVLNFSIMNSVNLKGDFYKKPSSKKALLIYYFRKENKLKQNHTHNLISTYNMFMLLINSDHFNKWS